MMRLKRIVALTIAAAAGCAGQVQLPTSVSPVAGSSTPVAQSSSRPLVYVSNSTYPPSVTEYAQGHAQPLRTLPGSGGGPMAFGPTKDLYVSGGVASDGKIDAYRGNIRILTIENLFNPSSFAVDSHSYVYVVTGGVNVEVYKPLSGQFLHDIRQGVNGSQVVAIDRQDNLYVGNYYSASVSVYTPTSRPGYPKLAHVIKSISNPRYITFGAAGNIYIANAVSVRVYDHKTLLLSRTIEGGLNGISAIAVDATGRLYVANAPHTKKGWQPGWISVYAPGQTKEQRRITDGVDVATGLAVDSTGDLYVANSVGNAVTVYGPGGTKPVQTITNGIRGPNYVAIGPAT